MLCYEISILDFINVNYISTEKEILTYFSLLFSCVHPIILSCLSSNEKQFFVHKMQDFYTCFVITFC
jgi:hypothetical protein